MERSQVVPMVHYACTSCSMSATGPALPMMAVAWLDHMESHPPEAHFREYRWEALSIPFEPFEE